MASRVTFTRVDVSLDPRPKLAEWRQNFAEVVADSPSRRLLLWRTLWLPYWIGSEVPAPRLPARDKPVPDAGPAGNQVVRMIDQIARKVWIQRELHILARSCWLGLLAGFFWLIIELSGGPDLTLQSLLIIWTVFLVPGPIFALLSRPSRQSVARMLDRSFNLHERMSTALGNLGQDLPSPNRRASVVYLQIADTANVATELRNHSAFKIRAPIREIVAAIAIALLLASLFFLRGTSGEVPAISDSPVPRFAPATERFAQQAENAAASQVSDQPIQSTAEVEAQAQRSQEARRDLQQLAQALDDHAVTRSAAEAIQRGDYEEAASDLRDLSQNADQMSPEAREGLADDLEQAAGEMSEGSQELADSARQAAEGLREGGDPAKQGVKELGDSVEQTGEEVVSQKELANQMQQAQAAEASGQQPQNSAGAQSESDQASQSAAEAQHRPGQQSDQPGQTGEPSDGADAQPGQADQASNQEGQDGPQQSRSQPGAQQQGGQQGADGQQGEGSQAQGEGQEPGQSPGGDPNSSDANPPLDSETGSSAQSNQGNGAGSGEEGEEESNGATGSNNDGGGPEGQPPSAELVENDQQQGEGTGPGEDPRSAVQLSRSPDGEGVQTSGDSGSATNGSGSGVSVSGGTSVQGEVGQAGPDSNRVPPAYRSLVESYFSDGDQ
jgi:hypothetical protein